MSSSDSHTEARFDRFGGVDSHQHILELQCTMQHNTDNTDTASVKSNVVKDDEPLHRPHGLQHETKFDIIDGNLLNHSNRSPMSQEQTKSQWGVPNYGPVRRSTTARLIKATGQTTASLPPTRPILFDQSHAYVYSLSSSGSGRTTNRLGAIGDRRGSQSGTSSVSGNHEDCDAQSHSPVSRRTSVLHGLIEGSTPDLDRYEIWKPDWHISPLTAASGYETGKFVANYSTNVHLQHVKTRVIEDQASDSENNDVAMASGTITPKQPILPRYVPPLKLFTGNSQQQSIAELNEMNNTTSVPTRELRALSLSSEGQAVSASTPASSASLHENDDFNDGKPVCAPTWRRSGPSLTSKSQHIANRPWVASTPMSHLGSASQDSTFHDKLDPEEFSLPHGSIVYSMRSNNITNLYNSVKHSVWTSTLGSNKVLTEAYQRKKPEGKIILLFSITNSLKHGSKYLGMAEMVAPLDLQANCTFLVTKNRSTQGIIPIRWIVAKDVPFARFSDLTYHEQPVTQVRHGNTIPGEVGRLVVQRYFEAAHGSTATLHPSNERVFAVKASNKFVPSKTSHDGQTSLYQRPKPPRQNSFVVGPWRSAYNRQHHNGPPPVGHPARRSDSSDSEELPQHEFGSSRVPAWRRAVPRNAQRHFQGRCGPSCAARSDGLLNAFLDQEPAQDQIVQFKHQRFQHKRRHR